MDSHPSGLRRVSEAACPHPLPILAPLDLRRVPLAHALAAGGEVDEDSDVGQEEYQDEPACLGPAAQVVVAEDVREGSPRF